MRAEWKYSCDCTDSLSSITVGLADEEKNRKEFRYDDDDDDCKWCRIVLPERIFLWSLGHSSRVIVFLALVTSLDP